MAMFGGGSPRPMIAALSRIYPQAEQWGYLLLRVAAGAMLVPHGWPKLMAGPAAVAAGTMTRRGIEPVYAAAWIAIVLETVGAACIVLGFLTRPVALLLVIEFAVIVKSHLHARLGRRRRRRRVRVPVADGLHLHPGARRRPVFGRRQARPRVLTGG